jgi:ribonuclease PH
MSSIAAAHRIDGRLPNQLRPVKIVPDYLKFAEGSVLIRVGDTRVVCAASIEDRVPGWMRGKGAGWVTGEYSMLPRAGTERSQREASLGRIGGRTHEIQRLIGRSLRACIDLAHLGERTITLDCDVLEADGGTRCAAITGACVALALALAKLQRDGSISRWPLRETVAAVSVGICAGQTVLDLAYAEDSEADVDCNIVGTASGAFVEIQCTAERRPFSQNRLDELLGLAKRGLSSLAKIQEETLSPHLAGLDLR